MTSPRTRHLLLHYLTRGGHLSDDDYAVLGSDRDRLDQAIWKALSQRPGQASASAVDLTLPPSLDLDSSTGGPFAAGQRYFYVYTLVDVDGIESLPSPENFVIIPAAVASPSAPTLTPGYYVSSTLLPGTYLYAFSAYKGASTYETTAPNQQRIVLSTGQNQVLITFPPLPAGADGFNIYRRRPGATDFRLIQSVDMTGGSPPSSTTDYGLAEDPVKGLPQANNTNSIAQVEISLPGATPVVPDGYTWKIYRTVHSGIYTNALLHWVVEETSEGSGIITPTYTDIGLSTSTGAPPTETVNYPSYPKINLNDAQEIVGVLPPANVVYLGVERFIYPGPLAETLVGTFVWTFPFHRGKLRWVIISLGYGSSPAVTPVIVDIEKADPTTDSFSTIYPSATKPTIEVGDNTSAKAVPDTTTLYDGDRVKVDLTQIGGGATPTDADLLVQLVYWYWDATASTVTEP